MSRNINTIGCPIHFLFFLDSQEVTGQWPQSTPPGGPHLPGPRVCLRQVSWTRGRRWQGLAPWGTERWRGPASPDHIPVCAPTVLVQQQCQEPLVLALDLDGGCPEGVCHCLQQTDSSCERPLRDRGPCQHLLPSAVYFRGPAHRVPSSLLQGTRSRDKSAEPASGLPRPLGLSFLQFFSQSVVLNFKPLGMLWLVLARLPRCLSTPISQVPMLHVHCWGGSMSGVLGVLTALLRVDYIQNYVPGKRPTTLVMQIGPVSVCIMESSRSQLQVGCSEGLSGWSPPPPQTATLGGSSPQHSEALEFLFKNFRTLAAHKNHLSKI